MEAISFPASSSLISTTRVSGNGAGNDSGSQQYVDRKVSNSIADAKPGGITKPKQSKSRNGCSTCKAKRLKCDETKPICNQCVKRKVTCGGYKKDFKWRAFSDAVPRTPGAIERSWSTGTDIPETNFAAPSESTSATSSSGAHDLSQSQPRRTSSLSSELTFPTPEQLLKGSNTATKREHGASDTIRTQATARTDSAVQYIPNTSPKLEQPGLPYSIYNTYQDIQEGDIEEVPRQDLVSDSQVPIRTLSSSSSSSSGFGFPIAFNQPRLAANSPEMLALNFDRNTCGILSMRDGINENPWRTLVWPMAKDSPALYHAIASLSAFHCSVSNYQMKITGMNHMSQSISQLYTNINHMSVEQALATSMALALADTWDTSISTGKEHVRGGSVLISQALVKMKRQQSTTDTSTLRFLCNTWLYMDVLSRLTSLNIDDADADCPLWSQIDLLTNSDEIDPLLGCASTLFPIIGRVANLVSKVRKTRQNSLTLISTANELKQELLNWSPPAYLQTPEDPTCAIQHSITTAEAYQWATLLYLHQAVPELPSRSAENLAQKVLLRLATVPVQSRTVIVHIYPLLAASCEVTTPDDRAWALERWTQMHRRMQISNIDRCIEVVKEVWNRRDAARQSHTQESAYYQANSVDFDGTSMVVSSPTMGQAPRRNSYEQIQHIPLARTVRGNQHWAGIMHELNWEVMLG